MDVSSAMAFIFPTCILGLGWALFNWFEVSRIKIYRSNQVHTMDAKLQESGMQEQKIDVLLEIGEKISDGAIAFLRQEYLFCSIFCLVFSIILGPIVNWHTTITFLIGSITSMYCGYIGMRIATYANYRTSYQAMNSLSSAFQCAYRSGCVMGFSLVSISLGVLCILVLIFKGSNTEGDSLEYLFDNIAGYGLGGSTVALFGRVGGGIYTKAADVGADLVGKIEQDLPEDSPRNPATIADNVGDNVGDIAGMGADLFGSFAESTCAALVVSATLLKTSESQDSQIIFVNSIDYLMYPLVASAFGILACILTAFIGIYVTKVNQISQIESTLKYQLVISTVIITPLLFAAAYWCLPETYYMTIDYYKIEGQIYDERYPWHVAVCSVVGLWAGLIIGYYTEYMTSHSYEPVREVAGACSTGAATNIIYGLALGYQSTVIPIICIAVTSYTSFKLLGFFGVAVAALGMLGNLAIGLSIDAYGPISDNAGGIAEMSELGDHVRERTDALDAAGNTTAAIGKGFAIGSAALVSLSLYGGFITRAKSYDGEGRLQDTNIDQPLIFAFLLIGAMLPYWFSAFTMKSVGKAALGMVLEIRRQIRENPGIITGETEPDFKACIEISTKASLREMIAPGLLVILTPMIVGLFFGAEGVAGLLPGALISGVQMAISSANTGGAWDNAKKYIESGQYQDQMGNIKKKGSDEHKAAVVGDTVGDPLKDTSGPALNILIKLMAILSLVFAEFFCKTGWISRNLK